MDAKVVLIPGLFIRPHPQLPCGLVARIPGFHPGGPGSIPGMGICFYNYFFFPTKDMQTPLTFAPFLIKKWAIAESIEKSIFRFLFF